MKSPFTPASTHILAISTMVLAATFASSSSTAADTTNVQAQAQPSLDCELQAGACAPWKYVGQTTFAFANDATRTHAHDAFRLWADADHAYVAVDMRWDLSRYMSTPATAPTGNPLFECGDRTAKCNLVKMDNERQVSHIVGGHGDEVVAEVETYSADSLNSFDPSYAQSIDGGRTWSPIALPAPCTPKSTCTFAFPAPHRYVLLVTDLSADSFDAWTTRVFLSKDSARTWTPLTQGKGLAAFGWNAAVTPSTVNLVQGQDSAPKSITEIDDDGRATTVLSNAEQLRGRVFSLLFERDTLYALLDSGAYPATGARLYAVKNGAATQIWADHDNSGGAWATPELLVVDTWNSQELIKSVGEFRRTLHVSTDRGAHWQRYVIPDELTNSDIAVAGHRIWAVSGKGIAYFDVR